MLLLLPKSVAVVPKYQELSRDRRQVSRNDGKAEEVNKPSVEERSSAKELLGEMVTNEADGETRMLEFVRQHSNLVNVKEPAVSPSYQKKHINSILKHKDLLTTQLEEGFDSLGEEEQQHLLDLEVGGTPEQQLQRLYERLYERLYDELVPMMDKDNDDDDDAEDDPVQPPLVVVKRITRSRGRRDDSGRDDRNKQTVAATPPVKGTGTAHSSRRRRRGRSSPASPEKSDRRRGRSNPSSMTKPDRRRGRSSPASMTKRAATASDSDRRLSPALLDLLGPDNIAQYYIQFGKFLRRYASCWEEQTKTKATKRGCWKTIHEMVSDFDKVKEAADCLLKLQAHELEHTSHDAYGKPKPIGEGGFAKVYRMKKADNGRLFALKLLDSDTEKNVKELTREAQIQMEFIDHPVIVKVVDYGITGIYAWILLEWIDGCNLEDYSKDYDEQRFGDFVPDQAAQSFLAAAVPALYHFRLKRIGHRDLKPNNWGKSLKMTTL